MAFGRLVLPVLALAACSGAEEVTTNVVPAGGPDIPDLAEMNEGPDIAPPEVEAMIARSGAARTVATLDQRRNEAAPSRFDSVLNGIASGEPAWLALVPRLRPGLEDEARIGLEIALSQALRRNAAGVLALVSADLPAERICRSSLIEPTPEEYRAYQQEVLAALRSVDDPSLAAARSACEARLRAPPAG